MSKLKNVWIVFSSLVIMAVAVAIAITDIGPNIVVAILSVTVFIYAIRQLAFYFTMARHMVDGMRLLFKGVIALDFSVFLMSMSDVKTQYIMIYLIVIHFVSGAIDIFRALEIKKLNDKSWKKKAVYGAVNILVSILCIMFIGSYGLLCIIYGFGLVLTAFRRISQIFTRPQMVYIQ